MAETGNIIRFNARRDNLKRSQGHWFLDMVAVSATIPPTP